MYQPATKNSQLPGILHTPLHAPPTDHVQLEVVEDVLQLLQLVLLQADEAGQAGRVSPGAVHAVHHVTLLVLLDEQQVEHLHLWESGKSASRENTSEHRPQRTRHESPANTTKHRLKENTGHQ